MAIFKFSMKEFKPAIQVMGIKSERMWGDLVSYALAPEKDIHVVDLIHDDTVHTNSANTLEFEKKIIQFETDDPLQTLVIDINVLNKESLSKELKFVGISCQPGEEEMIHSCQCILFNDPERVEIDLNREYDLDRPTHVIVKFRMPKKKDHFSFYLNVMDLIDTQRTTPHLIDPGVGNGPPKPKLPQVRSPRSNLNSAAASATATKGD